jgi:hypothetical protein
MNDDNLKKKSKRFGSPSSSGFGSYNFLHPGNNNLQGRQNVFLQFVEVIPFLNSSRQVSRFHMVQGNCLDFFKSDFCEVFEVLLASSAFFSWLTKKLMLQAQRLLDEASKQAQTHAAMQCKQRDQQKEMIKKHEVIYSFSCVFGCKSEACSLCSILLEWLVGDGNLSASSHYSHGRDHEIVREIETHPKAVPLQINIEFCVVMGLQV